MRSGLFLPPFNELSDPRRLVEVAVLAEESGWDGVFLWDHVLRRPEEALAVADPWVCLAAMAAATSRVRLGTMVTPLVRRRPQVLVRQVVTLDHLSGGRAVLGLGLGVDTTGELSRFGELVDERRRGDLLDEGVALVAEMMSGEHVVHRGRYFTVDGASFLPRPVQQPRLPIVLGARGSSPTSRAVRRAAAYDGLFLVDAGPGEVAAARATVEEVRGSLDGFELAVLTGPDGLTPDELARSGATWAMRRVSPAQKLQQVVEEVALGPPPGRASRS